MARKLEEFQIFSIVAWVLILGFAAFTASLAVRLSDTEGYSGQVGAHRFDIQDYLNEPE